MLRRFLTLCALLALALATTACRDRDLNTPIAGIGVADGQGGIVTVTFTLRNNDTSGVRIQPQFSALGGGFQDATEAAGGKGLVGLVATPGGTLHEFRWDALTDLGPGSHVVLFRVIPFLGGTSGTIAQTVFTVRNNDLTQATNDLSASREDAAASPLPGGGVLLSGGAGLTAEVDALDALSGAVSAKASMAIPREQHAQVTVQVDAVGRSTILAIGGFGLASSTAAALDTIEVYDPAADAWSTASTTLTEARFGLRATVLSNLRHVVITGGATDTGVAAGDVVIDGATLTESAVAGTASARSGHTSTLLPDGTVLVVGGRDGSGAILDSTVIVTVDPATGAGTASAGPTLAAARADHAAALLGDTVVIVGGTDGNAALDDAEQLDVSSGAATSTFTAFAGTMATARQRAVAVALGDTEALLVGGNDGTTGLATLERLVLSAGTFVASRQPMGTPRERAVATPFGAGQALLASGASTSAELYRAPGANDFGGVTPEAQATVARVGHTATLLASGRVLLAGGTDGTAATTTTSTLAVLASAERFDREVSPGSRFSTTGSLTTGRRDHAAAAISTGAALIGGQDESGALLASIELFAADAATFSVAGAALPAGRAGARAAALPDGTVLIVGGRTQAATRTADALVFDPSAGTITATTSMAFARADFALVVLLDGRVLVAGGDATGTAEVYDPSTGQWTTATDAGGAFGVARTAIAAVRLASGDVVLGGGADATGAPVADVALFLADSNTLESRAALGTPRAGAVAIAAGFTDARFCGGRTAQAVGAVSPLAAVRTASIERYATDGAGSTAAASDPDLSDAVSDAVAVRLGDGSTLIHGGVRGDGNVRAGADRSR